MNWRPSFPRRRESITRACNERTLDQGVRIGMNWPESVVIYVIPAQAGIHTATVIPAKAGIHYEDLQ